MTQPPKMCIEPGCHRAAVLTSANGSRCHVCERQRNTKRNAQPHRAAYNDSAYRTMARWWRGAVCHICHLPGSDTVDHVVPLIRGGSNTRTNLRPAHRACNSSKGAGDGSA